MAGYPLSSYRDAIAFGILILVLLLRPERALRPDHGGEGLMTFLARGVLRSVLPFLVGIPLLLVVQTLLDSQGMDDWTIILISVGINVVLAVSLNVVNGFTGQFSLGHAGFMAVGAYTTGQDHAGLRQHRAQRAQQVTFAVALLGGMAMAALAGLMVGMPSLRLRGDYLAIVTLGFGEIIRSIIENVHALGKAIGLSGLPGLTNITWTGVAAIASV